MVNDRLVPQFIKEIIENIFKYNIVGIDYVNIKNTEQQIRVIVQGNVDNKQLDKLMEQRMNVLRIQSFVGLEDQCVYIDYSRVKTMNE